MRFHKVLDSFRGIHHLVAPRVIVAVAVIGLLAGVAAFGPSFRGGAAAGQGTMPLPPTETVLVYPVKYLCGSIPGSGDFSAGQEPPVKPGNYATAINIQNVLDEEAPFSYWASVAFPDRDLGLVSPAASRDLGPRRATEIDCPQIVDLLAGTELADPQFVKGFLTVESELELEVVAVYTSEKLEIRQVITPIEIILNTGFDQATGLLIPYGDPDDDWNVISVQTAPGPPLPSPPFDAVVVSEQVVTNFWGGPVAGPDSRWVSMEPGAREMNNKSDQFIYEYRFHLPADSQDLVLDLNIAADDFAIVELNGLAVGLVPGPSSAVKMGSLGSLHLRTGPNALTVRVVDQGGVGGFDAVGKVTATQVGPVVGVGTGMSMDVEYIKPRSVERAVVKECPGDVNGDCQPDFLVLSRTHLVSAFNGADGTLIYSFSEPGPAGTHQIRLSLQNGLDLDGDGLPDFATGIFSVSPASPLPGAAFAYSGVDGDEILHIEGHTAGDSFGWGLAITADAANLPNDGDGDGIPEIVVGAPHEIVGVWDSAGSHYLYSGADGITLLQRVDGGERVDAHGFNAARLGDLSGDEYPDYAVSAIRAPGALFFPGGGGGTVYVYDGKDGGLVCRISGRDSGAAIFGWFGSTLSDMADVGGDGSADILVGARMDFDSGVRTGKMYAFDRCNSNPRFVLSGEGDGDIFGSALANLSDVTGDTREDIIVGARLADPDGKEDAGRVYLFNGLTGDLIHTKDGELPGDEFGVSVAALGDVNGDGVGDFAVGAWDADAGGLDRAGLVYVYSGLRPDFPLLYILEGQQVRGQFGLNVASLGP